MFWQRTFFSIIKKSKQGSESNDEIRKAVREEPQEAPNTPKRHVGFLDKIKGSFNPCDDYFDDCDSCEYDDDNDDQSEMLSKLLSTKKSFSSILFEYIDKKGISDAECYKRAGIDRRTFSKIRCDSRYKPSKSTILALAIALELNVEETDRILKSSGFALSDSITSDIIVKYYIVNGKYDILKVNEMLHRFGEAPLN